MGALAGTQIEGSALMQEVFTSPLSNHIAVALGKGEAQVAFTIPRRYLEIWLGGTTSVGDNAGAFRLRTQATSWSICIGPP